MQMDLAINAKKQLDFPNSLGKTNYLYYYLYVEIDRNLLLQDL